MSDFEKSCAAAAEAWRKDKYPLIFIYPDKRKLVERDFIAGARWYRNELINSAKEVDFPALRSMAHSQQSDKLRRHCESQLAEARAEIERLKAEQNKICVTTKYDKFLGTEDHSVSLADYIKLQQAATALLNRMAEALERMDGIMPPIGKPCGPTTAENVRTIARDILKEYHKSAFAEGVTK